MKVEVEFLAQARALAGVPRCSLELGDGAGLRALFAELRRNSAATFATLLDGSSARLLVFVDDVQVDAREDSPLRDGARVLLTTPMAGG